MIEAIFPFLHLICCALKREGNKMHTIISGVVKSAKLILTCTFDQLSQEEISVWSQKRRFLVPKEFIVLNIG